MSMWKLTARRLLADKVFLVSSGIVFAFLLMMLASFSGMIASDWSKEVGEHYAPPHFLAKELDSHIQSIEVNKKEQKQNELVSQHKVIDMYGVNDPLDVEMKQAQTRIKQHVTVVNDTPKEKSLLLGADKWGHDVIQKTIKGSQTSLLVGLIAALIATIIGTLLGAFSGYFGGLLDDCLNGFYNVFTSIPYLLLILAVAAVLQSKGVVTVILILGLTGWTGVFRLVRAEYIKHRQREYVLAAECIGASHMRRMFIHIFPNISHIPLVQLSLLSVGFIKSEVILSFLGFGVPVGVVSWGSMLNEAQNELILGKWWQLVAVTATMALLITAFSLLTDGLRDALDPKLNQGKA